jgi:hypothetical protein
LVDYLVISVTNIACPSHFEFVHMHQEGVCLIICVRVTCTLDSFVFRRSSGMIEITIGWAASLFVEHSVIVYYLSTNGRNS